MYRFDTTYRTDGVAVHACNGETATDARALARKLGEAGAEDGPVEAGRIGRRDWMVASLHQFAATTLSEGDRGFKTGVYAPYPPRDLHPALDHAIAVERGRRKSGFDATPARVVAANPQNPLAGATGAST